MAGEPDVLSALHVLEYPYTRSVGPVIGRFLGALREGSILGARTASGRVICPPHEYDPDTAEDIVDLVEVGPAGVVTTWAWVPEPRAKHPLQWLFAWALIRLDGADTAMLHVVDAQAVTTGMRVRPRWRAERTGHILDIEAFEPEERG